MISSILKTSALFSAFAPEALEELITLATEVELAPATHLIQAGETNDSLWLLLDGDVVIRDVLPGGLELDLVRLKRGDLCGELSFADDLAASASVVAETDVRLLRFRFDVLRPFFARHPDCHVLFLTELTAICARRLRHANEEIRRTFMASLGLF